MYSSSPTHSDSPLRVAAGLAAVLALAACASTPPPTASLQAAHEAISGAERAEAGRYAPTELSDARSKLSAADTAVAQQHMTLAEQLANESRADAQLATAKTADVKAQAVNEEMKHGTGTLIEEMQRHTGAKP